MYVCLNTCVRACIPTKRQKWYEFHKYVDISNVLYLTQAETCYIDNQCYLQRAQSAADPCFICDITISKSAWTPGMLSVLRQRSVDEMFIEEILHTTLVHASGLNETEILEASNILTSTSMWYNWLHFKLKHHSCLNVPIKCLLTLFDCKKFCKFKRLYHTYNGPVWQVVSVRDCGSVYIESQINNWDIHKYI